MSHGRKERRGTRIYNGYPISPDTYNQVFKEAKNSIQSRIFCSIWNVLGNIIAAIAYRSATTISDGICYAAIALFLLYLYIQCYEYIKRAWNWSDLKKENPLIWILFGIVFVLFWNVFGRLEVLETGYAHISSQVKRLDTEVIKLRKDWNGRFYTPAIADDGWWKPVDDRMIFILKKMGISRASLGWGCFMEGTRIQIDELGNTVTVEELHYGDYEYVYNGEMRIDILITTNGTESGYMYQFMTADLLSVNVTKRHPMKMCVDQDCDYNIAAMDVQKFKGNVTVTNNGYQEIVEVRKIDVDGVNVYNVWLDLADDLPVSSRVLIANGIYTFDLLRQKEHH